MALKSGLELYAYAPTNPQIAAPYAALVEALEFVTQAPGGFTTLKAKIKIPNARLPRPELAPFARIALMAPTLDTSNCVWLGEIMDPELAMTQSDGTYYQVNALGIGNTLRDDPRIKTYSAQTASQIVSTEMSDRSAYLVIDSDTSQIFPDNPATTYSPSEQGRSMEEVVADIAQLAGDYQWGTWAHPTHRDAAGFPTGQLTVKIRDSSTTHFTAFEQEAFEYHLYMGSSERAYNDIAIGYNDQSQNPPVSFVEFKDARLNADKSQGTAPFRYRKYYRDLAGVSTITKAQAQAVANVYGAEFQNLTNKGMVILTGVRDAYGNPIPLWNVAADHNIFLPWLSVYGSTLPTAAVSGTNLFYIVESRYTEDATGKAQLTLQLDNWVDWAMVTVSRLQLQADTLARTGGKTTGVTIALGAQQKGPISEQVNPTTSAQTWSHTIQFPGVLTQAPTSVTLTASSQSNITSVSASNLTQYGFQFNMVVTSSASPGSWVGTYLTNGNCLLDVDAARGTFAHHCDGCGVVRRGLSLKRDLVVERNPHHPRGHEPGMAALSYRCPLCGATESFSTNLGPEDEDEARRHSHVQARLIRQVMRHPHVGLPTRETALGEPAVVAAAAGTPPPTTTTAPVKRATRSRTVKERRR